MSYWIKVHEGLRDHPKTARLADLLGCSIAAAGGHVVYLWTWSIKHVPTDGSLGTLSASVLARQATWDGDPDQFEAALTEAGFIDGDTRMLHDWPAYTGEFYKARDRREKARMRQRRSRAGHANSARDSARMSRAGHANGQRDDSATSRARSRPRVRVREREEREISLKTKEDEVDPLPDARPESTTEFEAALRRTTAPEDRDGVILDAFHWQHGIVVVGKKRQGLLGYCRSYGHAHVLATIFSAAEAFPDHPEAYVLKMLATPPARSRQTDQDRRSADALAALEAMEAAD